MKSGIRSHAVRVVVWLSLRMAWLPYVIVDAARSDCGPDLSRGYALMISLDCAVLGTLALLACVTDGTVPSAFIALTFLLLYLALYVVTKLVLVGSGLTDRIIHLI